MTTSVRCSGATATFLLCAAIAGAQTPTAQNPSTPSSTQSDASTRPATTTFFGDTGIWYVPTAEIIGNGKWSGTVYRRGTNWIQGYTNVADFAGTFAVGVKDRAFECVREFANVAGPVVFRQTRERLRSDVVDPAIQHLAVTLDEVDEISRTVAHDIRNQYTIGYKPTNPRGAGGFRTVRVEARAKGHGKMTVRTKSGYYAGGQSAAGSK